MAPARVFGAFTAGRILMAASKKGAAKKVAETTGAASKTVAEKPPKKSGTGGIQKVVPVSSELGRFLSSPEVSRTEAVKKVWEYIKQQNLQNPNNKKEIICDEKLKAIFAGKDKVVFTEIAKLLANHFVKSPF